MCRCGTNLDRVEAAQQAGAVEALPYSDFAEGLPTMIPVMVTMTIVVLTVYWVGRPPPARVPRPPPRLEFQPPPDPVETQPLEANAPAALEPAPEPAAVATPSVPLDFDRPLVGGPPLADAVDRMAPGVVIVEAGSTRGSGFFVAPDTILTSAHVTGTSGSVNVTTTDGNTIPAKVETASQTFGIAVLRVANPPAGQLIIPMGSSAAASVGQDVFTIGPVPGTRRRTVTHAAIRGIRQSGTLRLLDTDAPTSPTNSGAPLLDKAGTAIGVTTAGMAGPPGLNVAVGIEFAAQLIGSR